MDELSIRPKRQREKVSLTLRDIAAPVFRQRRLTSLIFAGIFLGALIGTMLLPRSYEAEMKILVNRDRVDAVVTPDPNAGGAGTPVQAVSEEDLNSEVELLKGRDLLEKVVLACGLQARTDSGWHFKLNRLSDAVRGVRSTPDAQLARAVQDLEARLVAEPLKKTNLIRASYTSRDPQLAARVLATLASLYQEKHAAVHRPAGTFSFFDQQTSRYQAELSEAESQLTDFDGNESIIAPAAQKQLVLQQVSQFETDLQQENTNAYAAAERVRALRAQATAVPTRQTTQTKKLPNAQLLAQLESTLLSLELKRSDMLMKYAPSYPPVVETETEIAETRKAIAQAQQPDVEEITTDRVPTQDWIATEIAKAQADQAQLQGQAAATARVVRRYNEMAQQLNRQGTMQDDLVRDVKTAEDNYLLYLHKREEARISDALDSKRIVNVSVAEAATVPVLPTLQLGWLLIGSFFTAATLSLGTAYAVDRMDPSFRTPAELGQYLDLDVLASIPTSNPRP